MKVKSEREVTQSFPTLSDAMDCSLPGSSVHGIFQARILEWVATAFSAFSLYLAKFFRFHWKVLSQLPKLGLNASPVFPKTLCPYPYHNTYHSILDLFFSRVAVYLEHVHACSVASVTFDSLWPYGLQPARLLCLWDSPGKNTGVGCHLCSPPGDLPDPQTVPGFSALQVDSLPLSHQRSPYL